MLRPLFQPRVSPTSPASSPPLPAAPAFPRLLRDQVDQVPSPGTSLLVPLPGSGVRSGSQAWPASPAGPQPPPCRLAASHLPPAWHKHLQAELTLSWTPQAQVTASCGREGDYGGKAGVLPRAAVSHPLSPGPTCPALAWGPGAHPPRVPAAHPATRWGPLRSVASSSLLCLPAIRLAFPGPAVPVPRICPPWPALLPALCPEPGPNPGLPWLLLPSCSAEHLEPRAGCDGSPRTASTPSQLSHGARSQHGTERAHAMSRGTGEIVGPSPSLSGWETVGGLPT